MALPTKHITTNEIAGLDTFYNGGKGSGNFGHKGREGEVGGSAPRDGEGAPKSKDFKVGETVEIDTSFGEKMPGEIVRKLTEQEKKDRAFQANPDAGDYYVVKEPLGDEEIYWEGRLTKSEKVNDKKMKADMKTDAKTGVEKLEKAIKDFTNDKGDFLDVLLSRDSWEKFEQWALKSKRFSKDELEKITTSKDWEKYLEPLL